MALRGMTIAMRDEFKHFGVRTCCVAPGPFKTAFFDQCGQADIIIDDYEELRKTLPPREKRKWEDNVKGAQLIIDANELEEIPETLFLGKVAIDIVRNDLKKINDEMDKYEEICSHCGAEL
ncbi:SDR family NAD(P)-dependent oxidoreductase [Histomonas meleagridis]|uniref:SDR family NAD(P)-dependent oxidoreductase n=1 Tax=Histomonas meleagridis TaxID=135588 RepID=UPI00355A52A2|nr:SDR family NAD(P)-dependent oxidoreductase [Histomonas meleagridis]KAH0806628.1 SDR family NAD(P)-dependent oxidoreductase [Histomonas meleagridis]